MLQEFFESTAGQVSVVAVLLLLFAGILFGSRKQKSDVLGLVISALFIGLYLVLNQITLFHFPQGGSVTAFSMLAITACAYFLGLRQGLLAGLAAGLVGLIFNPWVIHPLQLLLDYPLAVGALGFAALLRNKKGGLVTSYLFGVLCRYICVFLSGAIFFGSYAPEGWNAVLWSAVYNFVYIAAEAAVTAVLLSLPPVRSTFQRLKRQLEHRGRA